MLRFKYAALLGLVLLWACDPESREIGEDSAQVDDDDSVVGDTGNADDGTPETDSDFTPGEAEDTGGEEGNDSSEDDGVEPEVVLVEAEDGELAGLQVEDTRPGFSGTGYVTGFDADTDSVTVTIDVDRSGGFELYVGYSAKWDDKESILWVNGQTFGTVALPYSKDFTETKGGKIHLTAGQNQIRLLNGWGYYDIDYFRVESADAGVEYTISETLVSPQVSSEAQALYDYLRSIFGQKSISGQYWAEGANGERVYRETGHWSAVSGFDFYYPYGISQADDDITRRAKDWYLNKNGIVTFSWHWFSPLNGIPEAARTQGSFYTDSTDFDLNKALVTGTDENRAMLRDIDRIANLLKILENAGVPVLWRPLHEAEGGWFWWGAKGPEAAIELWKPIFDRCMDVHGLTNLIWVWNSESPDWYPGDAYVDIFAADIYLEPYDYSPSSSRFYGLVDLGGGSKMVAMAENGTVPDPVLMEIFETPWAWFNTWHDFIMDETHTTNDQLRKTYNHENVITREQLPDLPSFQL